MLIADRKNILRKEILSSRKNFDVLKNEASNKVIYRNILTLLNNLALLNDVIGIYWPIRGEPDLLKLLVELRRTICLPRINAAEICFVPYILGSGLERYGKTEIYQPVLAQEIIPKIVIVPAFGFSIDGYRLGFGKGHYDKYLTKIKQDNSLIAIGACFHENLFERLPVDQYDYKMDYIVTDQLMIRLA